MFSTFDFNTNLALFDAAFPPGAYTFTMQSVPSNPPAVVDFPPTLLQPPAPHVSNFDATQTVDPTQPFTLSWDPFIGGNSSNDAITLALTAVIGLGTTNLGSTTIVLSSLNGFPGTTTSALIPAYTLWPNTNYAVSLNFYHFRYATNGTANLTQAFRVTNLNLVLTTLADTSALTLGSPSYSSNTFGFDVFTFPGANVTIEYNTNLAIESWQTLYSTNSPSYRFGFNTPLGTNQSMFFRVRTGP